MNKSDLIEHVATLEDVASKAAAGRVVDALFDKVAGTLASGEEVAIAGIGTFHVVARQAREGRNPKTGEALQIPAKNVPKFRAGKKLKDAVNEQ
ncbi:DNA binding protein [Vibrio phage D148]